MVVGLCLNPVALFDNQLPQLCRHTFQTCIHMATGSSACADIVAAARATLQSCVGLSVVRLDEETAGGKNWCSCTQSFIDETQSCENTFLYGATVREARGGVAAHCPEWREGKWWVALIVLSSLQCLIIIALLLFLRKYWYATHLSGVTACRISRTEQRERNPRGHHCELAVPHHHRPTRKQQRYIAVLHDRSAASVARSKSPSILSLTQTQTDMGKPFLGHVPVNLV